MVSWLLPIALLPKTYTYYLFDSSAQLALPLFGLFILVKLYLQPTQLETVLPKKSTLRIWGAFIVVQLALMGWEYLKIGESLQVYGLIHGFVAFMTMLLVIWVAYTIQKMSLQSFEDAVKFAKSGLIALVVYLALIVLPQMLVMVGFHQLDFYVNGLAKVFERHWQDRDFYDNGSYVTTLHRLNGFEPEASFLALLLGMVFSPALIMLVQEPIKNFRSKKWLYWLGWGLIAFILVVMMLAKTTTGFLLIGLLGLIFLVSAPKTQKIWFGSAAVAFLVLVALAYQFVPPVTHQLNTWLFEKSGTDNRLGGTIGLLQAWLHHPILGVGFGFESHYINEFLPKWSKDNLEYIYVYKKTAYPILNDMLGWLTRFGLVFVLMAFWLLAGLLKRAALVLKRLGSGANFKTMFYRVTVKSFFVAVFLVIVVASITPANATGWPMMLMGFFYWRVIHMAEDDLNNGVLQ